MTQTGKQLQQLAKDLLKKLQITYEDEQKALQYFSQAIESPDLDNVSRGDCLVSSGDIYSARPSKTKENYDIALKLYIKATELPGLPDWYSPHNKAERFALSPDIYGFNPEWRNEEVAANMHMQTLQRQYGGDLVITATDWFKNHLETSNIVNPKYTKVGFDYLEAAKDCDDELWESIALTFYGRAYKYHAEKTPEAFKKAIEWFEKSIKLDVDANEQGQQPWTIIGKGSARSYFELAELLSNPTRFGFDASLGNTEKGKKVYNDGVAHISRYGTLGPYSILESMYIDVFKKKLCYARADADLVTIKELCQIGRKLANDRDAALFLFEAVAQHVVCDKSIESYKSIAEAYFNCYKAKLQTQNSDWIAEEGVKCGAPLVLDCGSEDFPIEAADLEITKKIKGLFKEIEVAPASKYFNQKVKDMLSVYNKMYTGQSKHSDSVLRDRIRNILNFALNAHKESQEEKLAKQEIQKLEKIQLKLQNIQSDEQLYGYYDGIISTFSQAFTTAQVASSGQVQLDAGPSTTAKVGLKIVSYIPFFGDKIADPLAEIIEFVNGAKMISDANNICRLSPSQAEFCALIQDAVIEAMNERQHDIMNYKEESPAQQRWYQKIVSFVEKVHLKITETIYGQRYRSITQKLGNKHASSIIANFIANGAIYGEKSFLLPDKAKVELMKKMSEIWDEKEEEKKDEKKSDKTEVPEFKPPGAKPVAEVGGEVEVTGKKSFWKKLLCH